MLSGPPSLKVPNTLIDAGSLQGVSIPSQQQSHKPFQSPVRAPHHGSPEHAPGPSIGSSSHNPQSLGRPPLLPPVQGVSGLSPAQPPLQPGGTGTTPLAPSSLIPADKEPSGAASDAPPQHTDPAPGPSHPQGEAAHPHHHPTPTKQAPPLNPLPPSSRYAHHAFVPKPRAQSAFMRRHQAAHPSPAQRMRMMGAKGSSSARPRRASPLATHNESAESGGGGRSGNEGWTHVSSMGDLEALDAILDTLVVADPKIRQALLQGPLVSFETVVPEPKARAGPVTVLDEDAALRDRTFNLTSVPGVVEEGVEPDMEALLARAFKEQQEAEERERQQQQQQQQQQEQQLLKEREHRLQLDGHLPEARHSQGSHATAVVPVPILPKLARMYISSKQAGAAKAPPPPPPTAHWLVHSRPQPNPQAAPSYDTLCSQIRDVQRQYTCGTSRGQGLVQDADFEPGRPPRISPSLGMYISGLDGPALEEVAQAQGMPQGMERSRPSFVAMQQSKGSTRRGMRSRSPGSRARKSSLDLSFYHESAGAMVTTGENIDGNESPGSD